MMKSRLPLRSDDYKELIREVKDWPVPGVNFKDISGLLADPIAFDDVIYRMSLNLARSKHVGAIVSPDARGFLFGAPIASRLRIPFYMVRKPGKLPPPVTSIDYDYEYASGTLELSDLVDFGDLGNQKVVIVDDVNATGNTALAITELVRKAGAQNIMYSCFMDLTFLQGSARLNEQGIQTQSLITYED